MKGAYYMSQQPANRKLISLLSDMVEQFPDWRFHQILSNVQVNLPDTTEFKCLDLFYEDSEDTLKRVEQHVKTRT